MFHLYGLLIGLGLIAGMWVVTRQSLRFQINPKVLEDSLLWIAIPAVIGARLYHLITDWALYTHASLFQLIALWNGGLGYFGALIGGIVGIWIFSNTYKMTKSKKDLVNQTPTYIFFLILDLLAFGAPLAQAVGRFGNYFNQELFGLPTTFPWGILVNGRRYHPLFAYEAIGDFVIFVLINWLGLKKKFPLGKGQYACVYITLYSTLRFWLEFLRVETAHSTGFFEVLSIAQWVCLALAIGSITLFWLRRHADRGIEWEVRTLL